MLQPGGVLARFLDSCGKILKVAGCLLIVGNLGILGDFDMVASNSWKRVDGCCQFLLRSDEQSDPHTDVQHHTQLPTWVVGVPKIVAP
jgi:hypothetical protein